MRASGVIVTDEELIAELHWLGIDEKSYRIVALLPLVQVAWADQKMQSAERQLILGIAERYGFLSGGEDERRIVTGWLNKPPTIEYHARGRKLLLELARRREGRLAGDVDTRTLDKVVKLCTDVASAAGGLFGLAFAIDDAEKRTIADIAEHLSTERGMTWDELDAELD